MRATFNTIRKGLILGSAIGCLLLSSPLSAHERRKPDKKCQIPFSHTASATKIHGGHKIFFSRDDLKLAPEMRLQSATLALTVKGRRGDVEEYTVALNGIGSARRDHGRYFHFVRSHQDGAKSGDATLQVNAALLDLIIGGQVHFSDFLHKIKSKNGELSIWVRGPSKVIDASITLEGFKPCEGPGPSPSPSPSPTPEPVAPVATIDSTLPADSLTHSTTLQISFSSDQSGVAFHCKLDDNQAELCSSPMTYSDLTNGAHSFEVVAMNSAGLSSPPAAHAWTVDTIPFDVVIGTVIPGTPVTSATALSIEFSASDGSSGQRFQCSLDGAPYRDCAPPMYFDGLTESEHSIDLLGTDAAGNISFNPAHYGWRIDLTAPVANLSLIQGADTVTASTQARFEFSANESASFECARDDQPAVSCESPYQIDALTEGAHRFSVRAIDAAGNSSAPVSHDWSVDLTAPVVTIGNVVPAPGITNGRAISVEFASTEIARFTCAFDGGAPAPCVSPFTTSAPSEGDHSVSIQAIDQAGNFSPIEVVQWSMDFTTPMISLGAINPSAASYINSRSLSVQVYATEPLTYSAQLDGVRLHQSSSPIEVTMLADGPHTLLISGVDAAGNAANSVTHSFSVDTIAPIARIDGRDATSIAFSSNESGVFECELDGAGFGACTSPYALSPLADGAHEFRLRTTDRAGNPSAIASESWIIDRTPPRTRIGTATPDGTLIGSSSISIPFSVDDAQAISYCAWDGGATAPCASPAAGTHLSDGPHSFTVHSVDTAGNVESPGASYSFSIDTTAPTARITDIQHGDTIFFTADEQGTFACALDGGAFFDCVSPTPLSNLTSGPHQFQVRAFDMLGFASEIVSIAWTVDLEAPVTVITGSNPETAVFASRDIAISFTSNEYGISYCSWDGGAPSVCLSPATLSGLSDGPHQFTVATMDAAGNLESPGASYFFEVAPPIQTRIDNVMPFAAYTQATGISFEFSANVAGASFQCSLDGESPQPCTSPRTYSALGNGPHAFFAQAISASGQLDAVGATHTWTIDNVLPLIVASATTVTRTTMTITWTTNEPTTTALSWGQGTSTANIVPEDFNYVTEHSVTVSGLNPNTIYSYLIRGQDRSGNAYVTPRRNVRTSP